jgi:hypothetical protein
LENNKQTNYIVMKTSRHLSRNFSKAVFETIKPLLLVTLLILSFGFISIGSVSATSYGTWTATSGDVTHQTYDNSMSNTYLIPEVSQEFKLNLKGVNSCIFLFSPYL